MPAGRIRLLSRVTFWTAARSVPFALDILDSHGASRDTCSAGMSSRCGGRCRIRPDGGARVGISSRCSRHLGTAVVNTDGTVMTWPDGGAGGYRSFAVTSDGQLWHWGTPIPVAPVKRPTVKVPVPLDRPAPGDRVEPQAPSKG